MADDVGVDEQWRQAQAAVLEAWEAAGRVAPGWSVEHDGGDGAYRARFTVVGPPERRYSFSEAEFCQYVTGVADLAPEIAGGAALRLADGSREEVVNHRTPTE